VGSDNLNQKGESPKRVFQALPRPPVENRPKGESPKEFFRRMMERRRMAQQDPPYPEPENH
jgi:hypothetical protein